MSDVHILDLPIKDEPNDDSDTIASSAGLEGEIDDLTVLVLKDIKPFTHKLQSRVTDVEKDVTYIEKESEKVYNEIENLNKSFTNIKLRVDVLDARSRVPWTRKDDDQSQSSTMSDEIRQQLAQHHDHLLSAAHALNDHNNKIGVLEQALAKIITVLQLSDGTNLNDAIRELDTRGQIAEERIAILEEKSTTFDEKFEEVDSILGNQSLMPNEGEPADLLTRRVATMEQQTTKWVSTVTKTSELVSRLSLAQTINASVSADTTIDNDAASALNARIDDLFLRVDKLERSKIIDDQASSRGPRQYTTIRGGSAAGRRALNARGGNSNRQIRREPRDNWTPYKNLRPTDDGPLIDTSKSSVYEQPKPASFQVDEAQVSQEERTKKSIFNKQMNQISRMYQKEELLQKSKDIDLALSRAPPFLEVHELSYEQLLMLKEKVNALLKDKFSYVAGEQMAENDVPWG